jgi:choline dehydrogenase
MARIRSWYAMTEFDVLIVGAGTTGCVLAARLSENPHRRVLLVEAGPFYPTLQDYPPELARAISYAAAFPGHPNNWSFVSTLFGEQRYPMPRGLAVGGSSVLNGTYFVRGRPADFDSWAALGNPEWAWERVLPHFIRSETDCDFVGDFHGNSGPIPVRRLSPAKYHPVSAAFALSCRSHGFDEDADKNSPASLGVGSVPRNLVDGVRMNMALTYLGPTLGRPNLTLSPDTLVRRVIIENGRAVGIETDRRGERVIFRAGEIILSAGGIKSPHLLMLSGIGEADALRRHEIAVAHHSPGVGQHVMDHPSVAVLFRTRELHTELEPGAVSLQAYLNLTAPGSSTSDDVQISCACVPLSTMLKSPTPTAKRFGIPGYLTHPISSIRALAKLSPALVLRQGLSQHDLQLTCALHQERSTGEITLASADPAVHPQIDLNFLSHSDDLPRLRASVRLAVALLQESAFRALDARRTAPSDQDLADDDSLDRWVLTHLANTYHTGCSARMGPDSDPTAVVDQYCRVRGVEGLRVVDLSIMPNIIRRGTNATAVMMGERAAAFFQQ